MALQPLNDAHVQCSRSCCSSKPAELLVKKGVGDKPSINCNLQPELAASAESLSHITTSLALGTHKTYLELLAIDGLATSAITPAS